MPSPSAKEMSSGELYIRLLTYVRPHWKVFGLSLLAMGLASAMEPLFPALMKYLLDDGFKGAPTTNFDWIIYPLGVIGIVVVRSGLGFIGDYAMSWVSSNVISELRLTMFSRMLALPTSYFNENTSGRTMSRIVYDVGGVANAATGTLTTLVKDSLSVLGLLTWLLILNWKLTMVTFLIAPLIALVIKKFGGRMRSISRRQQQNLGAIVQHLQEAIEGNKLVKIFGGQAYERERFGDVIQEYRGLALRSTVASAVQGPLVHFSISLALAAIIGIALYQASSDQTTVGSFVSFITAMLMIMAPLRRLTDINAPIQRGLAAAESVFQLLDEAPEDDQGKIELGRSQGQITFESVSFSYPGTDIHALKGLNFLISSGESIALVGPSGSGKTTIANLLPRFFQVTEGTILIDGHPIESITLGSLRANIALVSQEVTLFNDTVAANIAYGLRRNASREEILAAAQAAHATEFIERLPEGLDTIIGEKGIKLSGGQRQRLAIARALLKDAPILILDEATSALDTESERQVQAALERLMIGRTTIVIAHRLSTIERVNRIFALQNGGLVEAGSHAELLALNGIYARLHQMQKLAEGER